MSTANISLFLSLETTINSAQVLAGLRNVATDLTIAGSKYDVSDTITNTSGDDFNSVTLWAAGDGGMSTFDLLWFVSDADALIELQNDNSDAVVIPIKANIPFVYGGGDELLDGVLGADGSATVFPNTINQVRAKNNLTGAATDTIANVRLLLFD